MTITASDSSAFRNALAGQYAIEREIGRGGMGIVYLARDLRLDRLVAIKTLPPHLASDAKIRERFLREARTAAALSHPGIVPIHRADEIEGQVFFVMGYVDGESMAQRLRRLGSLSPREVRRKLTDVALALDYAHSHGVVHRDIKLENILIDRATERALVTDFGIARLADAGPLTASGQVLGTVHYMSPEQASGHRVDGRSDLYALGVVGYVALAGRFPFENDLASAVLIAHVTTPPPPLLVMAPNVPRGLAEIIDRCLAKNPDHRFQSGADLAAALDAVAQEVDLHGDPGAGVASSLVSETEAQAVWKRAAELQALSGLQPKIEVVGHRDLAQDAARTSGYELGTVRDAAWQAGIPKQYVDHALAERGLIVAPGGAGATGVSVQDRSPAAGLLAGAPTNVEYEATVAGEMPERDFDILVDLIRRRIGEAGALTAVGRSLTWSTIGRQRNVHVSVIARNGKTSVRVVENMGQLAGALFGGIMGGVGGGGFGISMGIAAGVFHRPVLGLAFEAAILIAAFTTARLTFGAAARKRRLALHTLAEELADAAHESIHTSGPKFIDGGRDRQRT